MNRPLMVVLLLAGSIAAAQAFGLGLGNRFGKLGSIGPSGSVAPPPPACVSPTAPNGVVDLSQCSNAFYVAVIF